MKSLNFVLGVLLVVLVVFLHPLGAEEIGRGVKVTYLGHSAFQIVSPKGVILYIDPFLSGNPKTPPERKTA